jgi:hypothetical protein
MSEEQDTVATMIEMFCKAHHETQDGLCTDCSALLKYAKERVAHCPFGTDKPQCSKCTVHCYAPEMRERITEVMRFAGPRMICQHPLMALRHIKNRNRVRKKK